MDYPVVDHAVLAPMRKRHRNFQHKGPEDKLEILRAQGVMALGPPVEEPVVSLYYARNCFVHRLGRVGEKDMRGGNPLVVSWARTKVMVTVPPGNATLSTGPSSA